MGQGLFIVTLRKIDGEMGRWGDREMGGWGDGEICIFAQLNVFLT
ncbi:hypothetical protein [Okeania sp. SIO3B5]|nr:hypothetical protein [Okeania sp. SIO3B5]